MKLDDANLLYFIEDEFTRGGRPHRECAAGFQRTEIKLLFGEEIVIFATMHDFDQSVLNARAVLTEITGPENKIAVRWKRKSFHFPLSGSAIGPNARAVGVGSELAM